MKYKVTLGTKNSAVSQCCLHQLIVRLLEQTLSGSCNKEQNKTQNRTASYNSWQREML